MILDAGGDFPPGLADSCLWLEQAEEVLQEYLLFPLFPGFFAMGWWNPRFRLGFPLTTFPAYYW